MAGHRARRIIPKKDTPPSIAAKIERPTNAQEAERLTLNQYEAGTVAYTSVVTAQATALSARQTALSILQIRLGASVALIQALGGGWDASQLPTRDAMDARPATTR